MIDGSAAAPGQSIGQGLPSALVEYVQNIERKDRSLVDRDWKDKVKTHVELLSETYLQGTLSPWQVDLACVER